MPFVKGRMPEMLGTNISSTKPFYDKGDFYKLNP